MNELFEKAVLFHGHRCPGLAIGVRAAVEAMRILQITDENRDDLCCVSESSACFVDGLQMCCGCTAGNGKLRYNLTGKAAFSFYSGDGSVRLLLKPSDSGMSKEKQIRYILEAPVEDVFHIGNVRIAFPEKVPSKREQAVCALCGESANISAMLCADGQYICRDCG